ncbi:MAG: ATP-grasp domain-containing protein [Lachnospiraceae bacterium]|nr:ATP-grasp domain-containing protein [Lachnospiraceae bacterium]
MKAAIIGASGEAVHTIEKAHEYGLEVVALDGNPGAEGLKSADKPLIIDISDEAATIETLRQEKPDFVLTVPIGRYLTTVGAVNDALGLPGISREIAVLCTDKFQFHQRLSTQGLRNCRCYAIEGKNILNADQSISQKQKIAPGQLQLTYPAILKPRYGSGSRGIFMLTRTEELEEALQAIGEESYVLEECIAGEEYGVDGAVTEDGFCMILLRRKENTPPPARQAVGYTSILPSEGFWQQVQDHMKKVIAGLGMKECLLHADLIQGEEGPFVIELSARPSGHNLHNLFTPLAVGVDMAEQYIRYRMGLSYSFVPEETKSMMIHYFDMQGKVTNIPARRQVEEVLDAQLAAWSCNIRKGEELSPVSDGHSVMGRGYFVLKGRDTPFLRSQVEVVRKLFFR